MPYSVGGGTWTLGLAKEGQGGAAIRGGGGHLGNLRLGNTA